MRIRNSRSGATGQSKLTDIIMKLRPYLTTGLAALVLAAAGCTSNRVSAPSLTGPSTLGLGMTMQASPDILTQNGSAESQITIQTRDENGRPAPLVSVYVAIQVNGVSTDFGSLSAHNVVTNGDGQATLMYTAPPKPADNVDSNTVVSIVATPVGNGYGNSAPRSVDIRLVPPGTILPPVDFTPALTFTPSKPGVGSNVLFDASSSTDPSGAITKYAWDFGDGSTGTGVTATHAFGSVNTYSVTLTVSDDSGRSVSTTQQVSVVAAPPTASFTFSPTTPTHTTDTVTFDASGSTAQSGLSISKYEWHFGDGATATGSTATHVFGSANSFTVTLIVTDSAGQTATTSQTITVK